jgi:signal transduction histidine kinase/DNA-binding response OmpR family regulator
MKTAKTGKNFFKKVTLAAWVLSLFFCKAVFGQSTIVSIHSDTLSKQTEHSLTKELWSFQNGDQAAWAKPEFDDAQWPKSVTNFGEGKELPGWKGIGWFRLWIQVDTALTWGTLGLRINHDGASEVYIDGIYHAGYGKVGRSKAEMKAVRAPFEVMPFQLKDTKPHLIAIRYANFNGVFPDFIGFQAWYGSYEKQHAVSHRDQSIFQYMLLSTAAQIALAVLHLFLFIFYPKQRLNLYYVIFSVVFAGTNVAVSTINITGNPETQQVFMQVFWIAAILGTVSGWHLLYSVSQTAIRRWKVIVVLVLSIAYLIKHVFFMYAYPVDGFSIFFLLITMDGLWALIGAIKRKQPFVWLIGMGMVMIVLFYFFAGADVFGLWNNYAARCLTMSIGLLSFPLCFSIYLALDFARTNQNLSMRLAEVEKLSANALAQEAEKLELITQQAEVLENTVRERTAEVQRQADQLLEMDQVKSRFFVNLTHEFRTPLTLILGPAQQLQAEAENERILTQGKIIRQNAERLLRLINQLLDLSKLEAGKMELQNTATDVVGLARRAVASFESLAAQKQLTLNFNTNTQSLWVSADGDKLERILFNLLSNAIKFTGEGGLVAVQLQADGDHLELTVTDTGVGIPADRLPYIFDRFYQVDASDTRAHEGTGIGLAITKELIALIGGKLQVHSEPGTGTDMNVRLPVQIVPAGASLETMQHQLVFESPSDGVEVPVLTGADRPVVLVIEDHDDLREFLVSILSAAYQVITAKNGEEGIQSGLDHVPDLVVTDLMMPLKDGYQVCADLKQNEKTSHIPVVMLTAKADMDSKLMGIDTGADAYLAKPFDQRELLAIMANLINQRRQLREHYSKNDLWLSDTANIPSMEKVFLDKVKQAIGAHLDDEHYSVELLAEDVGLSRTQLHRKLKGLIDQSPGDLIRIIRLQQAYDLLKARSGTVSEIAYAVGFANPQSFSTSFSRYFGFTPSETVYN